jgi:hypothetical protein
MVLILGTVIPDDSCKLSLALANTSDSEFQPTNALFFCPYGNSLEAAWLSDCTLAAFSFERLKVCRTVQISSPNSQSCTMQWIQLCSLQIAGVGIVSNVGSSIPQSGGTLVVGRGFIRRDIVGGRQMWIRCRVLQIVLDGMRRDGIVDEGRIGWPSHKARFVHRKGSESQFDLVRRFSPQPIPRAIPAIERHQRAVPVNLGKDRAVSKGNRGWIIDPLYGPAAVKQV